MKKFLKKNWSNVLFGVVILLMIIPQTRMPIQVFVQRIISFSPSETSKSDREVLANYSWSLEVLNFEENPEIFQEINFSQSEEKVAIINFWATWCPPCVAEMPSFQKLYNDYGEKVDFYFVSSENAEKLNRFIEKHNYDLPVYIQTYQAPEQLQSNALPTTYLISKYGEIVIRETGAADWNSKKMRGLLDELLLE